MQKEKAGLTGFEISNEITALAHHDPLAKGFIIHL